MDKKVVEEKEQWKKCLVVDARSIDAIISINLEIGRIEDLKYNIADHLEKQEVDVVGTKQEIFKDGPSGDMVASIEKIEKQDPEQAITKTTCVSGYVYK